MRNSWKVSVGSRKRIFDPSARTRFPLKRVLIDGGASNCARRAFSACARTSGAMSSSIRKQHFLNFFPEPHGQGAFRGTSRGSMGPGTGIAGQCNAFAPPTTGARLPTRVTQLGTPVSSQRYRSDRFITRNRSSCGNCLTALMNRMSSVQMTAGSTT